MSALGVDTGSLPRPQLAEVVDRFGGWAVEVCAYLRDHNCRATPSRVAVIAALSQQTRHGLPHLSAGQVIECMARFEIALDDTTIYRTMTRLDEIGLIHHVSIQGPATVYGLRSPPHHHAICDSCGALRDIPADQFRDVVAQVAARADLEVPADLGLTVHGRCKTCQTSG